MRRVFGSAETHADVVDATLVDGLVEVGGGIADAMGSLVVGEFEGRQLANFTDESRWALAVVVLLVRKTLSCVETLTLMDRAGRYLWKDDADECKKQ